MRDFPIAGAALLLALFVAAAYGWIANIATLLSDSGMANGEAAVRAVGILVPIIGAAVGYF